MRMKNVRFRQSQSVDKAALTDNGFMVMVL